MKKFKKEKKIKKEKINVKQIKLNNEIASAKKFKQQYFDYYDDIKDYTKGREDW